jgi:hypothetical protein
MELLEYLLTVTSTTDILPRIDAVLLAYETQCGRQVPCLIFTAPAVARLYLVAAQKKVLQMRLGEPGGQNSPCYLLARRDSREGAMQ